MIISNNNFYTHTEAYSINGAKREEECVQYKNRCEIDFGK